MNRLFLKRDGFPGRARLLSAALAAGFAAQVCAWAGPQVVPVARIAGYGGQIFFEGENTSFSGNGDWLVAPGLKFNEKFSLVPTVSGKYRRVREVQELIGGEFLTRETFENTAVLKGLYALGESWKLKARGSYKNQMLVESADETLGKGLFDSHKIGFGLEAERSGEILKSLRFSLDPYAVRYYHYNSLASASQFGSEIDSGENTLDFNGYDATLGMEWALLEKTLLSAAALGSYRPFGDQKIVETSGLFSEKKRKDLFLQGALGIAQILPLPESWNLQCLAGADFNYAWLNSDQNNYDATRTRFNPDYYDYTELHAGPRLAARFFGRLDLSLAYEYSRRSYASRAAQETDGNYLSDRININTHGLSYSLKYPLARGFSIVAQGVYRQSLSNMKYERTYRYNYNAQHYFAGLSWEY